MGYEKPDEFTSEIISERILEAEGYLKHIFKNPSHRKNFVRSFADFSKINVYYNNYLTPLFISAFNIAHNKPVNSTTLLKIDHDLFNEAATIGHNPWFARARLYTQAPEEAGPYMLEPVQGKTTQDGKKQLRILMLGAHENGGESTPSKILKSYMNQLPEGLWDEIVIESMGTTFPSKVYPLDASTGKPSEPINVFPLNKSGEYKDEGNRDSLPQNQPGRCLSITRFILISIPGTNTILSYRQISVLNSSLHMKKCFRQPIT